MTKKSNGHDTSKNKNGEKIVKFPSLAERDRIRKQQIQQENEWRKSYRKNASNAGEPFFKFGNIPPFTLYMVSALLGVHIITTLLLNDQSTAALISTFAFIPGRFTGAMEWQITAILTPLTYMLFHSGWTHLIFNGVMTVALGTLCEKMFSTPTMLKFFMLCAIGGAFFYGALNPYSTGIMIGASGATSGMFAAAIMIMYEQGRFGPLTGKLANKGPWPLVAIWGIVMVIFGLIGGGIAWEAHLGGYLTGATLYTLMRKGKLRL